jgi:MFS family permease
VAVLVGAQLGGRAAAKRGPVFAVQAGILTQLTGLVAAATVLRTDTAFMTLALPLALFGIGAGMASSQLTNVILSEVPRERAGSAGGVATTNNAVAAALGVAVLGAVLRGGALIDARSARWALLVGAALLLLGSASSFAIRSPLTASAAYGGPPRSVDAADDNEVRRDRAQVAVGTARAFRLEGGST